MTTSLFRRHLVTGAAALAMLAGIAAPAFADKVLLNVSYDPTREFYKEFNEAFAADYKAKTGEAISVNQSHGGSGKQARAVIDGLDADVVTLALAGDIDQIAKNTDKLPKDWGDLAKEGVQVITPNPKTSGGARWNYLAGWAWAAKSFGGDEAKVKQYIGDVYRNVPVLDTGARGSTTTFAQRGIGDVFISWENEAFLVLKEFGEDNFEVIVPSLSILAEPPVAIVEGNATAKGNLEAAKAYLDFLYSPTGQKLAAKHYFRPTDPSSADPADLARFPKLELVTIDKEFGGWAKAQATHFADGGVFDEIYKPTN